MAIEIAIRTLSDTPRDVNECAGRSLNARGTLVRRQLDPVAQPIFNLWVDLCRGLVEIFGKKYWIITKTFYRREECLQSYRATDPPQPKDLDLMHGE